MRGFEVVREYDLTGVSAAQGAHKRFLSDVITDARSSTDGFDVLLIWALDRLSRQGVRATLEIIDRLHKEGIGIASFREHQIDTTGPLGELVIAIFSAMACLESERISQRTMAGLDRAREGQAFRPAPRVERQAEAKTAGVIVKTGRFFERPRCAKSNGVPFDLA